MENEIRRFKIDIAIDWDEIEIKKLRQELDALEERGATHIEFGVMDSSYSPSSYIVITPLTIRIETDKELAERIAAALAREKDVKRRDLALLERLKQQYEQ